MIYMKATDLYEKILKSNLINIEGSITFDYDNLSIKVKEKSAVGNLFQEWFGNWLKKHNIGFRLNPNTQESPDFFLHETSNETDLLEIKVFDDDAGAAFDVANFDAYTRSILNKPYKINSDYLIFSYTLRDGIFSIKRIWLKKIWEITGAMNDRPINLQVKQGVFVNIRPVKWYSDKAKFNPFNNRNAFLVALHEAIKLNPKKTDWDKDTWLEKIKEQIGN